MKVPSYRLEGDVAVLTLEAGGTVRVPLTLVERVVDDEIAPAASLDEPLPESPVPLAFHPDQRAPATPFGAEIYAVARRHAVNPELVAAMARAESAFDPTAVSRAGARGLMQLMPATAERFGVSPAELFDPVRNLEAGVAYLHWLIRRFEGDLPRVLAAYNAGEQVVERYGGVPPYRETIGYVERVSGYLGL